MDFGDVLINAIKSSADFPIDVELEGYPDVLFDIVFNDRIKPDEVQKVTDALEKFFIRYNRWHFKAIHYISSMWGEPLEQVNVFTVRIHIDFGNAMPMALLGAVKAIAKADVDIYRLILN